MTFIQRLWADETGVTAIEYGMIAALLALVSVPSFEALASNLSGVMTKVAFAECQAAETLCMMVAPN